MQYDACSATCVGHVVHPHSTPCGMVFAGQRQLSRFWSIGNDHSLGCWTAEEDNDREVRYDPSQKELLWKTQLDLSMERQAIEEEQFNEASDMFVELQHSLCHVLLKGQRFFPEGKQTLATTLSGVLEASHSEYCSLIDKAGEAIRAFAMTALGCFQAGRSAIVSQCQRCAVSQGSASLRRRRAEGAA